MYHIPDKQHANPIHHVGLTLEAFKKMEFDIVLASIPQHIAPFKKLIQKYQPQAKFIFQAGNNWGGLPVENLLTSATLTHSTISNNNHVFYHQEFDTNIFKPGPCKNIKSIIHLQHISNQHQDIEELMKHLPGWECSIYGAGMKLGAAPSLEIPRLLRDHGFLWHVKANEGYGYNMHHAFATGKPAIVALNQNKNMTPGLMYTKNMTVFDARVAKQVLADKLMKAADDYEMHTKAVLALFKERVNFDQDEIRIRQFLKRLI